MTGWNLLKIINVNDTEELDAMANILIDPQLSTDIQEQQL
jgi:hypothetical protein